MLRWHFIFMRDGGRFLSANMFICLYYFIGISTHVPQTIPNIKVHGANIGPTWVLSAPCGPHVGPMNLAIRDMPREVTVDTDVLLIPNLVKGSKPVHIIIIATKLTHIGMSLSILYSSLFPHDGLNLGVAFSPIYGSPSLLHFHLDGPGLYCIQSTIAE